MAELELVLKAKTKQLEDTLLDQKRQAELAEVRLRDAKAAVEKHAANSLLRPPGPGGRTEEEDLLRAAKTGRARGGQRDEVRDEVELLEAQLETKRAQHKAVHINLKTAQDLADQAGVTPKVRQELADLTGQAEVKAAEVREAEVRLAQAKRRLAALSPAEAVPDTHRRQWEQRASDLEKKLEALTREMEALRRELQKQGPSRP